MNDYKKFEKLLKKSGMQDYDMYTREDLIDFGVLVAKKAAKISDECIDGGFWPVSENIKKRFGIKE